MYFDCIHSSAQVCSRWTLQSKEGGPELLSIFPSRSPFCPDLLIVSMRGRGREGHRSLLNPVLRHLCILFPETWEHSQDLQGLRHECWKAPAVTLMISSAPAPCSPLSPWRSSLGGTQRCFPWLCPSPLWSTLCPGMTGILGSDLRWPWPRAA